MRKGGAGGRKVKGGEGSVWEGRKGIGEERQILLPVCPLFLGGLDWKIEVLLVTFPYPNPSVSRVGTPLSGGTSNSVPVRLLLPWGGA